MITSHRSVGVLVAREVYSGVGLDARTASLFYEMGRGFDSGHRFSATTGTVLVETSKVNSRRIRSPLQLLAGCEIKGCSNLVGVNCGK